MDKIKLTNFKNDNPLKRFPDFQILSNEEASEKVVLLARIFGLKNMSDGQGLLNIITAKSGLIPNISAEDEAFSLNVIFEKQNIKVNE
ncbi:MAG: hypothetical protein KKD07_01150, partial [Candidatus Omnitrophica bacterium]|nr:hypothetical protein [Candidatus Omnitrophota bacterium]